MLYFASLMSYKPLGVSDTIQLVAANYNEQPMPWFLPGRELSGSRPPRGALTPSFRQKNQKSLPLPFV